MPVSWGELIDKITILEIKVGTAARAGGVGERRAELALLPAVLAELADAPRGTRRTARRTCRGEPPSVGHRGRRSGARRRRRTFDAEFIELARSVYRNNDERSRIKRAINELLRSGIVEEKQYVGLPRSC